jgi:hypothetical protein
MWRVKEVSDHGEAPTSAKSKIHLPGNNESVDPARTELALPMLTDWDASASAGYLR